MCRMNVDSEIVAESRFGRHMVEDDSIDICTAGVDHLTWVSLATFARERHC